MAINKNTLLVNNDLMKMMMLDSRFFPFYNLLKHTDSEILSIYMGKTAEAAYYIQELIFNHKVMESLLNAVSEETTKYNSVFCEVLYKIVYL